DSDADPLHEPEAGSGRAVHSEPRRPSGHERAAGEDDERERTVGQLARPDEEAERGGARGGEQAGEEEHAEDDVARPPDAARTQARGGRSGAGADRERRHPPLVVAVVRDDAPADAVVAVAEAGPERQDELTRGPARDVRPPCEHRAAAVSDRRAAGPGP